MEPMYLSIQPTATGQHIRQLLDASGYTVKDVQRAMGFENPQAIYKWISGKSLPNLDNFLILSRMLRTSINEILVTDEDLIVFYGAIPSLVHSNMVQSIFSSLRCFPEMLW